MLLDVSDLVSKAKITVIVVSALGSKILQFFWNFCSLIFAHLKALFRPLFTMKTSIILLTAVNLVRGEFGNTCYDEKDLNSCMEGEKELLLLMDLYCCSRPVSQRN